LETAYGFGARIVMNYFSFFIMTSVLGMLACAVTLVFLGVLDTYALRHHVVPLFRMFQDAFSNPVGIARYGATTIRDGVNMFVPSDLVTQAMGRDVISVDMSHYDVAYVVSILMPTLLALKLFLQMISVGWTKIALDLNAGKAVSYNYLFKYYYLVPRVFVVNLCVFLATLLGTFLFIVPGIFMYQRLRFAKYFIIDKNLSIVKALQSSWALTHGSTIQLFSFTLVSGMLDAIGSVVFLFSLFLMPLHNQAEANVYTQLSR
ncbi:hypothetical protein KBD08_03725, partial [Candidatus Babeliales bacterium]|nr:hypothetical protein [Candidatus Babeliales bacterium]